MAEHLGDPVLMAKWKVVFPPPNNHRTNWKPFSSCLYHTTLNLKNMRNAIVFAKALRSLVKLQHTQETEENYVQNKLLQNKRSYGDLFLSNCTLNARKLNSKYFVMRTSSQSLLVWIDLTFILVEKSSATVTSDLTLSI